jgi:hypothetical protein
MLSLNLLAAREHSRELRATADVIRFDAGASPVSRVTLRYAAAKDAAGLRSLAELDSAEAPSGQVLVAEVDGRLRAALPLRGGDAIADPFHRGTELVELLRLRARQLKAT